MRFFQENLITDFITLIGKDDMYIYNYDTIKNSKYKSKIPQSLKKCCLDSIGLDYLNRQNRALSSNDDFDLAIITDKSINNITNLTDSIRGFIIVQKGECTKYSYVYCINLICSQHSKGAILIALYLYCINNNSNITDKKGLLELANSYYNMGGLCLYSKFGFQYDNSLYGKDCFDDFNNLPMIVDLNTKYKDKNTCNQMLKNILLGTSKGFPKPSICDMRGPRQLLLGVAMNVEKFLRLGDVNYIISYILSDNTVLNYDIFYNDIMSSDTKKVTEFINNIQSIPDYIILEYKNKVIELPAPKPAPNPEYQLTTRKRPRSGGTKKRKNKNKFKK
jgi:hypothetical protein